jgi:hypothetical protein
MENIYYLVLLCVGVGTSAACIFFTTCGCYHYIRNLNIANENAQNEDDDYIINEVFNSDNFNSTKKVQFDC